MKQAWGFPNKNACFIALSKYYGRGKAGKLQANSVVKEVD